MKLSKEAVQEYKEIYLKEFGGELLDAEASKQANDLMTLMRLLTEEKNVLP
jgi:hypothetical protein